MRKSTECVMDQRLRVIDLLARNSLSIAELTEQLRPRTSRRTVLGILAWLRKHFPLQIKRKRTPNSHDGSRVCHQWVGASPTSLQEPLQWLAEDELIALVAARGLLRDPDPKQPASLPRQERQDGDLLARAIARMLHRSGTKENADLLGRHTVTVSRFGAETICAKSLEACLSATVTSEGLEFQYINREDRPSVRHVAPQRMVLIKGEWYLVAWEKGLRTFRISRMSEARRRPDKPVGIPISIPSSSVDDRLRDAFGATGSEDPKQRRRVTLTVGAKAWPYVKGRRWGSSQSESPSSDAGGLRKISFVTSGIEECGYWILGLGNGVRVEEPSELRKWVVEQAEHMIKANRPPG